MKFFTKIPAVLFILLLLPFAVFSQNAVNLKWFQKISNGNGNFGTNAITSNDRIGEDIEDIGDLNGDGVNDIAFTTSFQGSNAGTVYILFMNSNGTIKSKNQITISGSNRLGGSLAKIGDLDGDGVVDLVVGATAENTDAGNVYIMFLNSNGTLKSYKKIGSGTTNFTTLSSWIHFGFCVEGIGDFDGDGVEDIAVGATELGDGGSGRGGIYIIRLKTDGSVKSYNKISSTSGNFSGVLKDNDAFGSSISTMGDYDGDGVTDLAVGTRFTDDVYTDAGAFYILRLNSNGTVKRYTKVSASTSTLLKQLLSTSVQFGMYLTYLPDFNGVGFKSIAVGSWYDNDNGSAKGAFYILHMDTAGKVLAYQKVSDKTKKLSGSIDAGDRFARSLCNYGSADTSTVQKIIAGAPFDDDGVSDAGAMYILGVRKYNLEISSILLPDSVCGGSSSQIRIVVKNLSNVSLSNIPLTIKGTGSTTFSFNDTLKNTIGSGKSDTLTFSKPLPTSTSGSISIKVWHTFFGDAFAPNDTLTNSVYITPTLSASPLGKDTSVCNGNTLTLDAGNTSAKHIWSTGATTKTISVSTAGTYWVRNYYSTGCYATDTIKVDFPKISLNLGKDTVLCQGQIYRLDAQNSGSSFLWSTGATTQTLDVSQSGSYWVKVSSGKCSQTDTVKVIFLQMPAANLGNDTNICFGQSLTLNARNSGMAYLWSTGSTAQSINVAAAGKYWVRISNGKCVHSDTVTVSINNITLDLGRDTSLCEGMTYRLDAKNTGSGFTWSTGASTQTIDVTQSGTYWVRVGSGNCQKTDTVKVTFISKPAVELGKDSIICAGQSLNLNAQIPSGTYNWSTGASTSFISVSTSGKYWVTVSNGKCVQSDTINVTVSNIVLDLGRDTSLCEGMSYRLDAKNSGSGFIWNTGATTQTIDATQTGTYWVKVSNGNCQKTDTVRVTFVPKPSVDLGKDTLLCSGETLLLNAQIASGNYTWSTGATTSSITVSAAGKYWVRVNNGKCTMTDTITVSYISLSVNLGNDTTLCKGQRYNLSTTTIPGASYIWNTGQTTSSISTDTPGVFWIKVSQGRCWVTDTVRVSFINVSQVDLGADKQICENETVMLDAGNPGLTYLWSTGETTQQVQVNTPGAYWVKVTNGKCTVQDTIRISRIMFSESFTATDTTVCEGSTFTLNSRNNDADSVRWSTGAASASIQVQSAGTYFVTVYKKQCSYSDTINVSFANTVDVNLGADTTLCFGSPLILDAGISGAQYTWSTGESTQSIIVNKKGKYWVVVKVGSCTAADTIEVKYHPELKFGLPSEVFLCGKNQSGIMLDPGEAATYKWYPNGETSRTIFVSTPGVYQVEMRQAGGCFRLDTIKVSECPPEELYIPNIFTPDADGKNDIFRVYNENLGPDFQMQIVNRWGEIIFESTDPKKGWDGKFQGVRSPEGVYLYLVNYRLITASGTTFTRQKYGTFQLHRH